jgi:hypothetical protein
VVLAGETDVGDVVVARVVAVHGINNAYSGPRRMAGDWVSALLDGVEFAGGAGLLGPEDVGCAFYGDVFRRPGRTPAASASGSSPASSPAAIHPVVKASPSLP